MQKFLHDRRGAVAPLLGITIFLLIGVGALAIELPRMASFTTDLQNAADAAALAGAAELTGQSGSINRATSVAINTFTNAQHFGSGSSSVSLTASNIDFLNAIPSHDSDAIPSSDVTTKDSDARYIRVTIPNQGINFIFSAIWGITKGSATVTAVAGNNAEVCQSPPIFICNPTEDPAAPGGNVDYNTADDPNVTGKSLRVVYPGSGAYGPGNFGILCPAGGTGTNCNNASNAAIAAMFAQPAGTCIRTQNVSTVTKTGIVSGPVTSGLNARFDDWDSTTISYINSPSWAPAYDVTQGRYVASSNSSGHCPKGGSGGTPGLTDAVPAGQMTEPLMPDSCLLTGTGNCSYDANNVSLGDGNWDWQTYMAVNHDMASTSLPADLTSPSPYEVYRWEIENPDSASNSIVVPSENISGSTDTTAESGQSNLVQSTTPNGYACYSGTGGTTADSFNYFPNKTMSFQALADRRVMPVAIEDCIENALTGGSQPITPVEYDYAFLIGPIGVPQYSQNVSTNNNAIFIQLLGKISQSGVDQMTHNVVRLYRR